MPLGIFAALDDFVPFGIKIGEGGRKQRGPGADLLVIYIF